MKKILVIYLLSMLPACSNLSKDKKIAAFNTLPSFEALLIDSTTILNSKSIPGGRPIILFYFRPDCPHCNKETKDLLNNIDSLKNVQIYFVSPMALGEIRNYCKAYQLENYKNIVVGKDYKFSFYKVFKPATVPYMAIYNSQKKLVKVYSEEPKISAVFEAAKM